MVYQKQIREYLQAHKQEMLEELKKLIKIPSTHGKAEEKAPFGKECAKVLKYVQKLYQENGYPTELDEEGGYLLSYYGNGEKTLGLFAHADVVVGGDGWIYTTPFNPIEKDGFLIGRGVIDDKSAIVASLYMLKMFQELNIPLQSKIVCYIGGNEESGMQDIRNYIAKHTPPNFSLVLDTGFPLYYGNKGVLRCMVTSNIPIYGLNEFFGGKSAATNIGRATAKLPYSDETYKQLKIKETETLKVSVENDEIVLQAEGVAKHSALPEGSVNAGFLIANALSNALFLCESDKKQMQFLANILPDIYGEKLEIAIDDPNFGKLTCVCCMVTMENGKLSLLLNIRFGERVQLQELKEKLAKEFAKNGFSVVSYPREASAHMTAKNDWYIQTCLDVYKTFTGEENAKPRINAGGTYALYLPKAAEIGITTWRDHPFYLPQGHGAVHEPDECISIDGFLEAMEIAALMILACDKGKN